MEYGGQLHRLHVKSVTWTLRFREIAVGHVYVTSEQVGLGRRGWSHGCVGWRSHGSQKPFALFTANASDETTGFVEIMIKHSNKMGTDTKQC